MSTTDPDLSKFLSGTAMDDAEKAAVRAKMDAVSPAEVPAGLSLGTTAGTACEGNDARLSDARTPTSHKTSHATGGSDPLTPADIGAIPAGELLSLTHSEMLALPANAGSRAIIVFAADTESFHYIAPGKTGAQAKTWVAANAEGNLEAGVELEDFTGQTPDTGVLGRVGQHLRIGDGLTEGGIVPSLLGSSNIASYATAPTSSVNVFSPNDNGNLFAPDSVVLNSLIDYAPTRIRLELNSSLPDGFVSRVRLRSPIFVAAGETLVGAHAGLPLLILDAGVNLAVKESSGIRKALDYAVVIPAGRGIKVPVPKNLIAASIYLNGYGSAAGSDVTFNVLSTVSDPGTAWNTNHYIQVASGPLHGEIAEIVSFDNATKTLVVTGNPLFSQIGCVQVSVYKHVTLFDLFDPATLTTDPTTTPGGFVASTSTLGTGRRSEVTTVGCGSTNSYYVHGGIWKRHASGNTNYNTTIIRPNANGYLFFSSATTLTNGTTLTVKGDLMKSYPFLEIDGVFKKIGLNSWFFDGVLK